MTKSRIINILHSAPAWLPQTQTWMFTQIQNLDAFIRVGIVCEQKENLDQFPAQSLACLADHPLHQLYDKSLRKLKWRRHLSFQIKAAKQFSARILHSHFGHDGWRNIPVAAHAGLKHVVSFYGRDVSFYPKTYPIWRERYLELFRTADRIFCEGSFMAQSLQSLGCPAHKIRIHHLGVETERIAYQPLHWEKGTPLRILIAGTFIEKKGIPYALQALAQIRRNTPLQITVIGDARPDEEGRMEKERILDVVEKAELREAIQWLGFQPYERLLQEAGRHHLFLSTSVTAANGDSEGGAPVTILEMAAAGLVIVSSRHCDIPEIIHHGETGMLAQERDADDIARQIQWLISHPDQWNALRRAARNHVEKNYHAAHQGKKLSQLYNETL